MKIINYLLWETYFFCFKLFSRYKKFYLIHLMGIFLFILSGLKHLTRGNKKEMKNHLFKGPAKQLLSMIGTFPK